jgi:serine/threonine protein kinase
MCETAQYIKEFVAELEVQHSIEFTRPPNLGQCPLIFHCDKADGGGEEATDTGSPGTSWRSEQIAVIQRMDVEELTELSMKLFDLVANVLASTSGCVGSKEISRSDNNEAVVSVGEAAAVAVEDGDTSSSSKPSLQLDTVSVPSAKSSGEDECNEKEFVSARGICIKCAVPDDEVVMRRKPLSKHSRDDGWSGSFSSVASLQKIRSVTTTSKLQFSCDDIGNKVINGRYTIIDDIATGTTGKVVQAIDNDTEQLVAIKVVRRALTRRLLSGHAVQKAQMEIAIMKKLRHKNIVSLYEVIDDPSDDRLYIVMQFINKGPIVTLDSQWCCAAVPEEMVQMYARQLLGGLRYLHSRKIIHRDIKPDNILIDDDGNAYLTDFGCSLDFSTNADENESGGTPAFMPPEACGGGSDSAVGAAGDIWSLGVTLYLLLFGKMPFSGSTRGELLQRIQTQQVTFPPDATAEWMELLEQMLQKNPDDRPLLSAVRTHPAINYGNSLGNTSFCLSPSSGNLLQSPRSPCLPSVTAVDIFKAIQLCEHTGGDNPWDTECHREDSGLERKSTVAHKRESEDDRREFAEAVFQLTGPPPALQLPSSVLSAHPPHSKRGESMTAPQMAQSMNDLEGSIVTNAAYMSMSASSCETRKVGQGSPPVKPSLRTVPASPKASFWLIRQEDCGT